MILLIQINFVNFNSVKIRVSDMYIVLFCYAHLDKRVNKIASDLSLFYPSIRPLFGLGYCVPFNNINGFMWFLFI